MDVETKDSGHLTHEMTPSRYQAAKISHAAGITAGQGDHLERVEWGKG